jgi:hypothetical protein
VAYSAALGEAVCARVAAGVPLARLRLEAGMPERTTLYKWARAHPDFGAALRAAQAAARRAARLRTRARAAAQRARQEANPRGNGGRATETYTPELAEAICRRLAEGESLAAIGRDPAMPCIATVYHWIERRPEFEAMYVKARRAQADTFADEVREVGLAATPATVWADRLRFDTLRWLAARLAPKKYCEQVVVAEAIRAGAAEDPVKVIAVSFRSGPNGEPLVAPPRCPEEADAWERAYGRPYDGPGLLPGTRGPGPWNLLDGDYYGAVVTYGGR